jgi:hypothetical protein
MKREKLKGIARQAMEDMAQEARFRPEDHQVLLKHKDRLLALTDELVKAFYDTLFATPNTRKVFHEGERPEREKTLRDWWKRTIEGSVDEDYWVWQAYVGLIHVKREVTNPMMVGQAFLIENVVRRHVNEPEVVEALGRLMATVAEGEEASRTPPPPGARVSHLRESSPSRRRRPRKGPERGPACMELRRIPGDPRINPARRGGGREAYWGWKGMRGVSRVRW